jgi:hypothetical protein
VAPEEAALLKALRSPPPIRDIQLQSNPERWSVEDTAEFLSATTDCAHLAHFMLEDGIDGAAFMLLTYPTVKSYWSLSMPSAIQLCQHVESVKLAHYKQFSINI